MLSIRLPHTVRAAGIISAPSAAARQSVPFRSVCFFFPYYIRRMRAGSFRLDHAPEQWYNQDSGRSLPAAPVRGAAQSAAQPAA